MKLLLDTHALLWWLDGDERLSPGARARIEDDAQIVLVSAASAWEIATKVRIGKLPGAADVAECFVDVVRQQDFQLLSITAEHARQAGLMPGSHRDPFDRLMLAQARVEGLAVLSADHQLQGYSGVRVIW